MACEFITSDNVRVRLGVDAAGAAFLEMTEFAVDEAPQTTLCHLTRVQCQLLHSNLAQVGGTIA